MEEGLLTEAECTAADFGDNPRKIDFGKLYLNRFPLLRRAYGRWKEKGHTAAEACLLYTSTSMLALDIYSTFYGRVGWEGVGQAKAVVFFIMVAVIALTQLYITRRKEVEN